LKIGARLGLAFAAICAMMVLVAVFSIAMLAKVNSSTDVILNDRMPRIATTNALLTNINDIALAMRNMMLSDNAADRQKQADAIMVQRREAATNLELLDRSLQLPRTRELLAQMIEANTSYVKGQEDLLKLLDGATPEEAKAYMSDKLRPILANYKKLIAEQIKFQNDIARTSGEEAAQTYENTRLLMAGLAAAILAVSGALAYWITISITRPLARALTVATTVAAGDLSSRIEVQGKDEVGQLLAALKSMNDSLALTVGSVRTGTETIATAAAQVAAGNQDLSARTEQQASSLEETASSMEELTSTVQQNADNARQAHSLASTASNVAERGGVVIAKVVETMGQINASASKIADIISVIDGIAFQTNILALNAAVEAARAGEQGRGFAVVATEVRNLAHRSAAAAKEIKTLIEASTHAVTDGSELVQQAGTTMSELVDSVTRVTDIMSEINAASAEQSAGIAQINLAITEMDTVTQQNAALVEEAAAASESMQEQAGNLAQVVSVFKLGASTTAAAPRIVATSMAAQAPAARKSVKPIKPAPVRPASRPQVALGAAAAGGSDWEEF
jgi:methyl-accepting chemotaxis protein